MSKPKNRRGRPPKPMPERIPDTPENLARIIMRAPPPESWDYLNAELPEAQPMAVTDRDRPISTLGELVEVL